MWTDDPAAAHIENGNLTPKPWTYHADISSVRFSKVPGMARRRLQASSQCQGTPDLSLTTSFNAFLKKTMCETSPLHRNERHVECPMKHKLTDVKCLQTKAYERHLHTHSCTLTKAASCQQHSHPNTTPAYAPESRPHQCLKHARTCTPAQTPITDQHRTAWYELSLLRFTHMSWTLPVHVQLCCR